MVLRKPSASQLAFVDAFWPRVAQLLATDREALPARYLNACQGNPRVAVWHLCAYLGKPGRIPGTFSALLDLEEDDMLARAIVQAYDENLRATLPNNVQERVLKIHLGYL